MTSPSKSSHPKVRLLSEQLEELRASFSERHATLGEIIRFLEGRAYTLLMIVFALPFAVPVSVPGSSTPLGIIIAVIAVQLALKRLPWLPRRLLDWRLPPGFFTKLIPVTARLVRSLERALHPRWPAWTESHAAIAVHLLVIVVHAFLLALPVIFPFTNLFPGWVILILACGLLERDGLFLAVGHALSVLNVLYFLAIAHAAKEAMIKIWAYLLG